MNRFLKLIALLSGSLNKKNRVLKIPQSFIKKSAELEIYLVYQLTLKD
jgi:hypothetical protein